METLAGRSQEGVGAYICFTETKLNTRTIFLYRLGLFSHSAIQRQFVIFNPYTKFMTHYTYSLRLTTHEILAVKWS